MIIVLLYIPFLTHQDTLKFLTLIAHINTMVNFQNKTAIIIQSLYNFGSRNQIRYYSDHVTALSFQNSHGNDKNKGKRKFLIHF